MNWAEQRLMFHDWQEVQVLLACINSTGVAMDDKPEVVMPLLKGKKE